MSISRQTKRHEGIVIICVWVPSRPSNIYKKTALVCIPACLSLCHQHVNPFACLAVKASTLHAQHGLPAQTHTHTHSLYTHITLPTTFECSAFSQYESACINLTASFNNTSDSRCAFLLCWDQNSLIIITPRVLEATMIQRFRGLFRYDPLNNPIKEKRRTGQMTALTSDGSSFNEFCPCVLFMPTTQHVHLAVEALRF